MITSLGNLINFFFFFWGGGENLHWTGITSVTDFMSLQIRRSLFKPWGTLLYPHVKHPTHNVSVNPGLLIDAMKLSGAKMPGPS